MTTRQRNKHRLKQTVGNRQHAEAMRNAAVIWHQRL